jgi:DNA-binding CsgD family transcriptional regulator
MHDQDVGYLVMRSNGSLLEANRRAVLLAQKYFSRAGGSWRSHAAALLSAMLEANRDNGPIRHRIHCPEGWDVLDAYVHRLAKESHDISEDVTLVQLRESQRDSFQQLPPQQRKIASLLAYSGLSAKQIADKLGIAEGTLRTHSERVYKALGVHSRPELMVMAMDYVAKRAGR